MSILKDQARSIGAKLSKLSRQLNVGYLQVLTEFLLERLAARLVADPRLSSRLVFKGGYVSLRVYDSPRYTIDLDALLNKGRLGEVSKIIQSIIESESSDGVWFRLEKTVDLETQGEYGGLRLVLRAGIGEVLPDIKRAQIVHLDIGTGDPIVPGPVKVETPYLLGGGIFSWQVYPVETTVAEKLHALVVRGSASSRSKDIFDLNLLLGKCNAQNLKKSITETFLYRGDEVPRSLSAHLRKIDRTLLKMGWLSAVVDLTPVPDFDDSFDWVITFLESFEKG